MEKTTQAVDSQSAKGIHLCVLVHGLWGNPSHLASIESSLKERYSEDRLQVLVAKRNSSYNTYDGIEVGGERVAQEIEEELEACERQGLPVTRLSIVGYSLGGLIARYSIGLLLSRGWFDKLEPVNFTAFASPFLGARTPTRGPQSHLWNAIASRMLSTSGRQLFLIDKFRDTGRPLLAVLTDPKSVFMAALRRFHHRALYANIVNDRSAPWYTTFISRSNPFEDLDAIHLNYMKGQNDVLLDPEDPVRRLIRDPDESLYSRLVNSGTGFLNQLPLYALFSVLAPIALTAFTVNAGIQTVRSNQRVILHNTGKAGAFEAYRMPNLLEGAFETVNSNQTEEHLTRSEAASLDGKSSVSSDEEEDHGSKLYRTRSRPDFPVLALDPLQFKMIEELNELGWNKYPVHIRKVRHSHAAIIVRHKRKAFDEGWTVLNHWLDKEFEI